MAGIIPYDFEKPLIELEGKVADLQRLQDEKGLDLSAEISRLSERARELRLDIYTNLTPWQRWQIARNPLRPTSLQYIQLICTDWMELHGDRGFRDDPAIVGGIAFLEGQPVTIIGHQKGGKDTKEKVYRNFGMAHPEGYRKALRLMKQAEKFRRPIICLIDTAGAYPGIGAEERGQAEAIAHNLREMSTLTVPIISVITGEGGSGGALGLGVADRVLMLENSVYSVITPEACGAIIWKVPTLAQQKLPETAAALRTTAKDLLELGVIEEILPEPAGGAHQDPVAIAATLKAALRRNIAELQGIPEAELVDNRYRRFRRIGQFALEGSDNQIR